MKRYLLFAYEKYYPDGGWNDFRGAFDSEEYAREIVSNVDCDYWHIVDSETRCVIAYGAAQNYK